MATDAAATRVRIPEGRYANFFRIGFNAQEFLIDFGQVTPDEGTGTDGESFFIRIVVVPFNMKRFLALARESVGSYEETYAIIPDAEA